MDCLYVAALALCSVAITSRTRQNTCAVSIYRGIPKRVLVEVTTK